MPDRSSNDRVFWTAAVSVVVLDVVTKVLAQRNLTERVPVEVFGSWARLTLAYNPGAAFGMNLGDYSRYIFGALALVALVVVWRFYRSSPSGDRARVLGLGLAWGGAAGNLIDRFRSPRGVVDFIDLGVGDVWRFWTFNVADSAVTIGAVILVIVLWKEDRERALAQAAQGARKEPDASLRSG